MSNFHSRRNPRVSAISTTAYQPERDAPEPEEKLERLEPEELCDGELLLLLWLLLLPKEELWDAARELRAAL